MSNLRLLQKIPTPEKEKQLWWTKEMGGTAFMPLSETAAKAKVGKYQVNWVEAEKAGFSIARERYFSWLVGHSQAFMDQVRSEIAAELADKELASIPQDRRTEQRDQVVNKYKEALKETTFSSLLKIQKGAYIGEVRERLAAVNAQNAKGAILALNEKYLGAIGKAIPHGTAMTKFIEGLLDPNSNAFNKAGGRQKVLSHDEMETAIIKYMQELGKITSDEAQDVLDKKELDEDRIGTMKEKFSDPKKSPIKWTGEAVGKTITEDNVGKLIQLWQCNGRYKKDVLRNADKVEKFIRDAYNDGQAAVVKVAAENPRKAGETLQSYEARLKTAIEKNLGNNTAAKLAYGNELLEVLRKEANTKREEGTIAVNVELRKITRNQDESVPDFLKRAHSTLMKNVPPYLQDIAGEIFTDFETGYQAIQAWELISPEINFGGWDDQAKGQYKQAFLIAVTSLLIQATAAEKDTSQKIRNIGAQAVVDIATAETEVQADFQKRSDTINHIFGHGIQNFLATLTDNERGYFDAKANGRNETMFNILSQAYAAFAAKDTEIQSYLTGKGKTVLDVEQGATIFTSFKNYLSIEFVPFRQMLALMEQDANGNDDDVPTSVVDKLKEYVNFMEQDMLIQYLAEQTVQAQQQPAKVPVKTGGKSVKLKTE